MIQVIDDQFHRFSEDQLMEKFYEGDMQAFDVLAARLRRSLLGQAVAHLPHRHVGRHEAAEDVVQQTLIKAVLTIDKPAARWQPGKGTVRTWLGTILRNAAISYLRSRDSKQPVSSDFAVGSDDTDSERPESNIPDYRLPAEAAAREAEARRQMQLEAINRLPADLQKIIRMKLSGLTHQEIAKRLGLAKSTVSYHFNCAKQQLQCIVVSVAA